MHHRPSLKARARLHKLLLMLIPFVWVFLRPWQTARADPFNSRPENLADVANAIAEKLKETCRTAPSGKGLKPVIYVSRNYFSDPRTKATYPLSSYLAEELRTALAATGYFDVTTDADFDSVYVLTGNYHREKDQLIITCRLKKMTVSTDGQVFMLDAASAREELEKSAWDPQWFTGPIDSRMRFLMTRREEKCATDLLRLGRARVVVVEKFRFQDLGLYSPFSAYVRSTIMDHLTRSHLLVPVTPKNGRVISPEGIKGKALSPLKLKGGPWPPFPAREPYFKERI